ncbi:MAG TPA: protein-glutamate O-methyltransferase [Candidatus Binatia bacterium]|nr:protein-glutamate O-methyltransferase [Candidatus Binatia bacterium]
MIPITEHEFSLFQQLIKKHAGISLSSAKKSLIQARLGGRLRELGLDSYHAYYLHLTINRGDELTEMIDRVCTNETKFFREPRHFEFLSRVVVHDWAAQAAAGFRPRQIRAWSAGCSTGEEPYSLAMVLRDQFGTSSSWDIQILGTDLSSRVLARARAGIWPIAKAREIPAEYLKRFMLKGTGRQEGSIKAAAEIASVIRFDRLNLNDDSYPMTELFDLILCRNVLIYFDQQHRAQIIDRLLRYLRPGGFFLIGHSERLVGLTDKVANVFPTIYVRIGEEASWRGGRIP